MEGRITTPTQSETHSCPECGVEFESTESLHEHFFDEHLVTQPEDATDAEPTLPEGSRETGSSVRREGGDAEAIEWPVQQAATGEATSGQQAATGDVTPGQQIATETTEQSVRQESTDAPESTGGSVLLAQARHAGLWSRPGSIRPSIRPGKVADVLVALLALVLAGTVVGVLLFVVVQVAL